MFGETLEARRVLAGAGFDLTTETASFVTSSPLAEGEGAANRLFPFSDTAAPVVDPATDIGYGHFNNDGFIDLVTTSNTEDTVSLLIGNGDGTFQESISFDVGAGPRALTVTDFNGDGLSDVAVATVTDVSVLLGTTQGFLTPAVRYGTFVGRERITVGDFTNDGTLDILTVGFNALEVFPGNGDGTFAESSVVYLSGAKDAVVAADFDGNGNLDAAVVSDNNEIRIYHGRGNGRFWSTVGNIPERFPAGESPGDLKLIDFDNDGIVDIATVSNSGVSLLIGVGDGTFAPVQTIPIDEFNFGHGALDFGDVNDDGLLDIVASGAGLAVLLGKTSGTFEEPLFYDGYGVGPIVLDVNSDGFSDVITAGGRLVEVALANGNGTLQAPFRLLDQYVSSSNSVRPVFSGVNDDFTGDGKDDLVGFSLNDATGSPEIHLRQSGPDRKLSTLTTTTELVGLPFISTPGDVNGDGRADLGVGDGLRFGNADGTFQLATGVGSALAPGLLPMISMNYDGDDPLDFFVRGDTPHGFPRIVVNSGDDFGILQVCYYYNDQNECLPEPFHSFRSHKLVDKGPLPDFDGDGLSDGVGESIIYGVGGTLLYLSDNDESDIEYFDLAPAPQTITVDVKSGDFDGDGKQDLVYADEGSELSLYLGNGDGTFGGRMAIDSGTQSVPQQLIIDDFNNDDVPDIVVYGDPIGRIVPTPLLLGNGDGTFLPPQLLYIHNRRPYSGDFDGDGWTDLATDGYVYFNVGGGGPRGDEARAARVTQFGGATVSSQVAVKYTLPRDSTAPVTLQFANSSDDEFDAGDTILGTITVSPETITASAGSLQLVGESASEALKEGEHELLIDAASFEFLTTALADDGIPQLFAFADATHQNAIDRGTFAPFRGFHLTEENRAVVRTGPESKEVSVAKGDPGSLVFSFELSNVAMTIQSATASEPNDILIVTSSADDFIHIQYDVEIDTCIRAGDGVNLVAGGAGNDNILGGADTDVLLGEGFDIDVEVFRNFLQNLAARTIELVDLDVAHFGAGNDIIDGRDGFDVIFGGPGNDEIRSGAGGGILFGDGLWLDATLSFNLQPLIDAQDLEEAIEEFPAAFELEAGISLDGDGMDMIYGGSGIDLVLAGAGNDLFFALPPEDTESVDGGMIDVILGNDGNDTINDRAARFTVALGGGGDDAILGSNSGSFLIGGDGNDTLGGGDGIDVLLGDTLDFGVHSNIDDILSGFGDGKLSAGFAVGPGDPNIAGNDVLSGGRGFDFQVGGYGNDYLEGGEGPGLLFGDSFSFAATLNIGFEDAAESESQSETNTRTKSGGWLSKALSLFSVDVDFRLEGTGDDTIIGSTGLDLAFGGMGEDDLFSGGGTVDLLFGNEHNDELRGGGNRTLLTELVESVNADASELREFGDRIRNKETLRVGGLDDSKFSIMVGGSGSDTLVATPAEDGVPTEIGGSILLGDDFRFLGIPTTFTDIFSIEFNGRIPVFFGIQFGVVQNGIDHVGEGQDALEGAAGGFNLLMGGDGDDTLTGKGFFDILMGDSLNLGADVSIDFRDLSLDKTLEENFDAIDASFELPGLAGTGADTIRGGDGFTIAIGGDGPDNIQDEGGTADLLFGNNGDDEIRAGTGFNLIVGGRDTKNALTPTGERRGDLLVGGRDATNVILGDTFQFNVPGLFALNALKNGDISVRVGLAPAGQGDDIIQGGDGLDVIIGGAGDDIITGGDGTNAILGDSLTSGPSPFSFSTKFFQAAVNALFGDPNRTLDDAMNALGLTDTGNDRIFGGAGTDVVFGGNGNDKIFGRGGFDFLVGGGGDDEVFGDGGRDIVFGGLGADELRGGEGDDHLESEEGADRFFGEEGNDRIFGGVENDFLFGGPGDDELFGEEGDDLLDGGTGQNTFSDSQGNNTVVERLAANDSVYTMTEAASVVDVLANDGNGSDALLLDDFTQPPNGTVTREDNGTPNDASDDTLRFTPTSGFVGVTSFVYDVRTLAGETDSATVSITVDASEMDYGDAPDLFGYPTSLAMNGARHAVGSLRLGSLVDGEQDALLSEMQSGTPYLVSLGDDSTGPDEDGIVNVSSIVSTKSTGTTASLAVTVSADGKLDGWIDFDHDGVWSPGEQVFASRDVRAGTNVFSLAVPGGAVPGTTHARFRLSSAGALLPTGSAPDGEVEDYSFTVVDGDLPDGASVSVRPPVSGTLEATTDDNDFVLTAGETELIRVPMAAVSRVQIFGTDEDDTLAIRDVEMIYSGLLAGDAGQGFDTLRLSGSGQHVDLSRIDETLVRGIEAIDARGSGNNSVALAETDIPRLSPSDGRLRVTTDAGDELEIGAGWSVDSTFVDDGDFIRVLKQGVATLELTGPFDWSNPSSRLDVNADGTVAPNDVLIVINELNGPQFTDRQRRLRAASSLEQFPGFFFDTSPDGFVSPLDALVIINRINSNVLTVIAEGEPPIQCVNFVLADIPEHRHGQFQFDGDPLNRTPDPEVVLTQTSIQAALPRGTARVVLLSRCESLERTSQEEDLFSAVERCKGDGGL